MCPSFSFDTKIAPGSLLFDMGDSRITSTSTGQYDMLLAMSQDSVNAAIANMWDVEGDELATIEYEGGPAGSLKGTLTGVDIQVLAHGASQGSVYFRMTFGEGEAKFWDQKAKKTLPFPMKGWKLALKVNIGKLHRSGRLRCVKTDCLRSFE